MIKNIKKEKYKIFKVIGLSLVSLIVLVILVFTCVYFNRFRSIMTLEKLTDYEDGYNLYSMHIKYDYDIQDVLDYDIKDTQDYVDAVIKETLPLLPIKMELPSYGCSAYKAVTVDNEYVMGRNYDFKLDTSALLVYTEPKDGYKSMSFVALSNIKANDAMKDIKTKMATLTAPFSALDGINEKGVSIAVLTLDSEPVNQDTGKQKVTSSLIIRLVLDKAANTKEAIELFEKYDMLGVNGRDYHYFVTDSEGNSVVIEYDPEKEDRPLVVTEIDAITNFYGAYIDKVKSNQKNGIYGHGKERYDKIIKVLEDNGYILNNETEWEALQNASSKPNPESVTSNTQWSIVYNNTNKTCEFVLCRNWEDKYSFKLN